MMCRFYVIYQQLLSISIFRGALYWNLWVNNDKAEGDIQSLLRGVGARLYSRADPVIFYVCNDAVVD